MALLGDVEIGSASACSRRGAGTGCNVDPCGMCEARAFSICDAVADEHLDRLARAATVLRLAPGETFVNQGEVTSHVFNITTGAVKLYKLMPDGRRQIVCFLFTGDFIGIGPSEEALVTAEALTPVGLCRFGRRDFRSLLDTFPEMEHRLLQRVSNDVAAAQEQMLLLGRKTAAERVASFLLGLSQAARRIGRPVDKLDLPMTRADIADYLGLTTETVSRVFTSLRKSGRIALDGAATVRVLDRTGLERLAAGA